MIYSVIGCEFKFLIAADNWRFLLKVAIFFGSKSDTDKMKKAAEVLNEFGVEYKAYVISAHRAGELLRETVKQVENDGCEVIIAGAGLAAALPGVIAGMTVLPVIGVPLECISGNSNGLGGMDALLSIVQMPPGIPVATVAINGALNAGLLAAKILATNDEEISRKVSDYAKSLKDMVDVKAKKLEDIKYQAYLDQM